VTVVGRCQTVTSGQHRALAQLPPATPEADGSVAATPWRDRLRATWNVLVGSIGVVVGLIPHVLHHIGLLAGTALLAGSGGTALFGAVGLLASVPFLLRLRRRFRTWRAPAIGLLVFAAMFSLSSFVIGPAISGSTSDKPPSAPGLDHNSHQ